MKIQISGLIIRELDYGEKDKIVSILTDQNGIISAIVKGARNIKAKRGSIIQCFSYCRFSLYVGKSMYVVDDFEILELFWSIRENLYSLSLAQYFSQLCFAFSPDECRSGELLRLFLNVMFYISNKKRSLSILKAIFEIRGCCICGYMPNLMGCIYCKNYDCAEMYFSVKNGSLICGDCLKGKERHQEFEAKLLHPAVLSALRHIVYSDFNKLFSFSILGQSEGELEYISEKYIYYHLGSNFKALDFYKSLF